jgi:RNA polymerase sigma-70 factor (ECF subfamily)
LGAERDEALKLAVLVLLEKLSPTERGAYVLREEGRRTTVSSAEQGRLLAAFLDAARQGDMAALEGLFAEDVTSYSDGGGMVRAARIPVVGRERVAKFIAAVAAHFYDGVALSRVEVNGQSAGLMFP